MTVVKEFVRALRELAAQAGERARHKKLPASAPVYAPFPRWLTPKVKGALRELGVERLYRHQYQALKLLTAGKDVGLVTPTASGKTLAYTLPLLATGADGKTGGALYLFPLKALARDQLRALEKLGRLSGVDFQAVVFDGDTPPEKRAKFKRRNPRVVLTNPEMLHLSMLAGHGSWAQFWSGLRCVVIDEAQVYRGAFGSHFAPLIRRLRRVLRLHGARPSFVLSSATIGRPKGFFQDIIGRPVQVIDKSGAPRGAVDFILWDPPGSPYTEALKIFSLAMERGLRTILFTKSRRATELIGKWISESGKPWRDRVKTYRAGYLPEERREIEQDLFSNRLQGIISTSALESGIDVGGLDVCIMLGFPGTIISTWQRTGRVGRRGKPAVAVMIAGEDALDHYWFDHAKEFFSQDYERVVFNPANRDILKEHVVCAASEGDLYNDATDELLSLDPAVVEELLQAGRLKSAPDGRLYSQERNPHRQVNLRGGGENYVIVNSETGEVMGNLEEGRALREGHEGAIYLHRGNDYLVQVFDRLGKNIQVARREVDYYTQVNTSEEVEVLEQKGKRTWRGFSAGFGRVKVTEQTVSYEKRRSSDRGLLTLYQLDMPPQIFETEGLWLNVPEKLKRQVLSDHDYNGSIHALEHALIAVIPTIVLCDRWDLGGVSSPYSPAAAGGIIYIYDGQSGGIGLARESFREIEVVLARAGELINDCRCEAGCPRCVQSPKCGSGNHPLDKQGAARLAQGLQAYI